VVTTVGESDMDRRSLLTLLLVSPAALAGWRRDNKEKCARIDARLKDIERRRRMGYSAKEGRKQVEQREKLRATRREECR
jgi:hypothetical protein